MKKTILLVILLTLLVVGVAYAAGEGWGTNCPGGIITELDGDGVMVHCTLWSRRCSDVVEIWNDGSQYIRVKCNNGKLAPPPFNITH